MLPWWKLYRNYTFNVKVNLQMALQPKLTPKYIWNVQANLFIASMVTIIQKLYTTCTGEPFYCFNGENCTEIIHSMYKWTFRSRYRRKYRLNIHGMYRRTFLLLQWWKLYRNYTLNVKVNLQMALQPKLTHKYIWYVQANLFIASMVKIIQKLYI